MLHVAVVAQLFSVHFLAWAASGKLRATLLMVTIFAHTFRIEVFIVVLAISNDFLLSLR